MISCECSISLYIYLYGVFTVPHSKNISCKLGLIGMIVFVDSFVC
jgi:hypothetical protein